MRSALQVAFILVTDVKWEMLVQSVIQNGHPCALSVRHLGLHGGSQSHKMLGVVNVSRGRVDLRLLALWEGCQTRIFWCFVESFSEWRSFSRGGQLSVWSQRRQSPRISDHFVTLSNCSSLIQDKWGKLILSRVREEAVLGRGSSGGGRLSHLPPFQPCALFYWPQHLPSVFCVGCFKA